MSDTTGMPSLDYLKTWEKLFVLRYIETGNGTTSMRFARPHLKAPGESAKQALRKENIKRALEEVWEQHRAEHKITVARVTTMLLEDRVFARDTGTASAAVSATVALAKLHGLMAEKVVVTKSDISEVSDDELIAIARGELDPAGRGRPGFATPGGSGGTDSVH